MAQIVHTAVTESVITVSALADLVTGPETGAVVSFSGDVRDNDHGRQVSSLTYEAHPQAGKVLNDVVAQIASQYEVERVAVSHRYGPIAIGECAFAVAVSARHRKAAFDCCAALVDEVKAQLPVWKHQVFTDGTDEWVNCA